MPFWLWREDVLKKIAEGWTPDVIIGRNERKFSMSARTMYRRFRDDPTLDISALPMKGTKPNGHKEWRGKQAFRRTLCDRASEFSNYESEFGHLGGDTIVGKDHKSAVITLAERVSKVIIALKPAGTTAAAVEQRLDQWFKKLPRNLFKSITFDCDKEFSNWKNICNRHDISIFFASPRLPESTRIERKLKRVTQKRRTAEEERLQYN
ncbi:hypothetical protein HMPREF9554_01549 [Treponema phagedenis F0421]|nr:hypothetical protein HMPREF9554_01549 [Treponema phagedenis F0421]TYT76886.1 IS30 family transposase [Treponema phagedenis]TYT79824.1 IS30 family transposase [Treponema phagedenis]